MDVGQDWLNHINFCYLCVFLVYSSCTFCKSLQSTRVVSVFSGVGVLFPTNGQNEIRSPGEISITKGNSSYFMVEPFDGTENYALWQLRTNIQKGWAKPLDKNGKRWRLTIETRSRNVNTIRLRIKDKIINNVTREITTAMWKALENMYLRKNLNTKLNLKREVWIASTEDGKKWHEIIEHINVFNGLVNQLAKVEISLEKEDKAHIRLPSLRDSNENLVIIILYGKEIAKMEVIHVLMSW